MNISRRLVLKGIASTPSLAAVEGAAAALPDPMAEHPMTRVDRLAWALAEAMDDWMDKISHPGLPRQEWVAVVHPSSTSNFPIAFSNQSVSIRSREDRT